MGDNAHTRQFIGSIFLNLVVHLIAGLIYFNPVDFVLQFAAAKEIARGKLLYRDIGTLVYEGMRLPRPQYPPLYLYTLGTLIWIVGIENITWQGVKLFLIACNLINGVLLYVILSKLTETHPKSRTISLLGMNWFLLNPATLGVVFGGYHEGFMLIFVLMAFYAFLADKHLIGGVGFGLALLTKPTAGLYMIPLLIWVFRTHQLRVLWTWGVAAVVFLLGSLPFLLIVPSQYIQDVFLIHATRPDPSMSIYTYFLSGFATTLVPFVIQSILIITCIVYLSFRSPQISQQWVLEAVVPLMALFLMFNRILYPHYIPFFFMFFSLMLIFRIEKTKIARVPFWSDLPLLGLLVGLVMVYLGEIWWSLLWSVDEYATITKNPFFPLSALICLLGLGLIAIASTLILTEKSQTKMPNQLRNQSNSATNSQ